MISPLKLDRGKNQQLGQIKKKLRDPSILKKLGNNTMHTFFNNNISEFGGDLEGMLDEINYRPTVHNIHKIGWKAQYFKSADVSMLDQGCGVSQYPQFYDTNKKIKCYHVHMWEAIQVKIVTKFCSNHGLLH